jgi:hypothetical protein
MKCHISNAVDGTHDSNVWNDSEEDVYVRSECKEGKGTDCEDGDSETNWQRQIESDKHHVLIV